MPWEAADTKWAIICVIAWIVIALAVKAFLAAHDQRRICVCEDSDNCICGGAWGRRKL